MLHVFFFQKAFKWEGRVLYKNPGDPKKGGGLRFLQIRLISGDEMTSSFLVFVLKSKIGQKTLRAALVVFFGAGFGRSAPFLHVGFGDQQKPNVSTTLVKCFYQKAGVFPPSSLWGWRFPRHRQSREGFF